MKICIIGGGGSVAVATRVITARQPGNSFEVFTKRDVAGYRPCELTYVLGKQIADFETIVGFDKKAMEEKDIRYHFKTAVTEINREEKYISTTDGKYEYDKIIIAAGSTPVLPPVSGLDGKGVYILGTDMAYARELEKIIPRNRSAMIIGAGAIGLEMAEVLVRQNYERVIVADIADRPLARSLDTEIAAMVSEKMQAMGIQFLFGERIVKVGDAGAKKRVYLSNSQYDVDFVVVSAGFRPNSELARDCGLEIGPTGGIKVNSYMQTSDPDIYAIGDVSESWDVISGQPVLSMKADNAVRTGKVAARHLTGDSAAEYLGAVGAFIIYLGETFVGGVGYTEETAASLQGKKVKAIWHEGMSLPKYMGGHPVKIKLVYDVETNLLLGAQMISKANIAAELDRLSVAISEKITARRLAGIETIYTPASGWPYGPVAQALDKCY
ncbi:FAD-dependent oxidoreductase [Phosphitispora fastidiosa]|uniref:FAD-dependent oxidoreductase n=1 Tax=Phosphitispora fastidiosa TaxID=2837202 RepID=UPI001E29AE15|nr:FAD-dependent oxidoreductase [Phosphitispora fastidiosa]MBU7008021.1 NADH oxidase (H2O2-forming) [Phosphitispora fastidiosa]